uniref:Uncharacterized protein n=1 Tax=Rangifer tarandus platyrhynchus TaxID=3082113 RepID=A0ACB0DY16_RANTA|nr:unnamed protein product [Rangifer tarandus platyrhynchus]
MREAIQPRVDGVVVVRWRVRYPGPCHIGTVRSHLSSFSSRLDCGFRVTGRILSVPRPRQRTFSGGVTGRWPGGPPPGRPPRPRPPRGRYPQISPQSKRRPSQLPRPAQTRDRPPRVWFSAGGLASPVPRPGPKPGPPVLRGHRREVSVDFIPGLPAGRGPSTCQSVEERRQQHHLPPGDRGRGDGNRRRGGDGLATETSGALASQSGLTAPRLGRPLEAGSRTGGSTSSESLSKGGKLLRGRREN